MRALRWIAGLCSVALLAACAVSVPELSVGSSGSGGSGGSGAGTGGGPAVDCRATSDCSSNPGCACVPSAGTKFLGPVLFAVNGAPVQCPAGFATRVLQDAFTHLTAAPPAKCNKCECGTEPCGDVTINAYANETCSGGPLATLPVMPDHCQGSFGFDIGSVMVSDAPASGSCTRSGGGVMSLPLTTHDVATLCIGDVGAGCGSGDVCVPAAREPFDVCVYQEGHVPCPSGFSHPHTVYMGTHEHRSCSECTCGDPAATCPSTFEAFSTGMCMSGSLGDGVAGTCFSAPTSNPGKSIEPHVKTPCAPAGGDPTGEVELTLPYTVCCSET